MAEIPHERTVLLNGAAPTRSPSHIAGTSVYVALGLLVLGAVALTAYFGSTNVTDPLGPISDVLFVGVVIFLAPPVLAVRSVVGGRAGRRFELISWVAIAGLAISGGGQVLLLAGLIPLEVSFITFGGGLALFLLWGLALWVPAVRLGLLSRAVAGWAVAAAISLVLATVAWFGFPPEVGYAAAAVLGLAMIGWLVSLGRALRRRPVA